MSPHRLPIPLLVSKAVTLATWRVIRECIFKINFLCVLFFLDEEIFLDMRFVGEICLHENAVAIKITERKNKSLILINQKLFYRALPNLVKAYGFTFLQFVPGSFLALSSYGPRPHTWSAARKTLSIRLSFDEARCVHANAARFG